MHLYGAAPGGGRGKRRLQGCGERGCWCRGAPERRPAEGAAKGASRDAGSAGSGTKKRRPARNVARDLAYYDNENNPSSDSLYNQRRKEFRKRPGRTSTAGRRERAAARRR